MEGVVKRVTSEGYGWITAKRIDYWFHKSAFTGDFKNLLAKYSSLEPGFCIKVEFEVDKSATRSPRALTVSLSNGGEPTKIIVY